MKVELHYSDPWNKIVLECPFCGRNISGVGPLRRHQRSCKQKLCAQCCRPKNLCPDKEHNYLIECGEGFNSKEYWEQKNRE